jgi:hypothetical protein
VSASRRTCKKRNQLKGNKVLYMQCNSPTFSTLNIFIFSCRSLKKKCVFVFVFYYGFHLIHAPWGSGLE